MKHKAYYYPCISSPNAFEGEEIVILGKLSDPCAAPAPQCNGNLVTTASDLCSVTSTIEVK